LLSEGAARPPQRPLDHVLKETAPTARPWYRAWGELQATSFNHPKWKMAEAC